MTPEDLAFLVTPVGWIELRGDQGKPPKRLVAAEAGLDAAEDPRRPVQLPCRRGSQAPEPAVADRARSISTTSPLKPYWCRSPDGASIRPAAATPPAFHGSNPAARISRSIVVAAASSS